MIEGQRFVIVDLRIPFLRLVMFFIKAGLAAIPAAIVVGFLLMVATALIAATVAQSSAPRVVSLLTIFLFVIDCSFVVVSLALAPGHLQAS